MLKVSSITLCEIHMPLVHFFETSFGRTTERRILLVRAECGGAVGWGECTASEEPFYNEESVETSWYALENYLAPALLGREFESARHAVPYLSRIRGHRMARAALENALWHAESLLRGVPLWKLLGGTRREIACGVSIGIQETPEKLLDKIDLELRAGYRRIKVKVKPGWDVDILERIRSRWPEILLSCDANSAYTLDQSGHLQRFDQFRLLMIEQPLWYDDIYFHSLLQRQLKTALCLDESIRHALHAEAALALGACRIVNIKLGRVGGFSEAIAVHNVCRSQQVPVWCGGMLEAGVGRSHNVALSSLENFSLPGDVSASKRYWKEDIIEPEVTVSPQGTIALSEEAGTGYRIREALIEKLAVRRQEFRASVSVPVA